MLYVLPCGIALSLLELWLEWSWVFVCQALTASCRLVTLSCGDIFSLAVYSAVTEITRCILLECQFTQFKYRMHTIFISKSHMTVSWSKWNICVIHKENFAFFASTKLIARPPSHWHYHKYDEFRKMVGWRSTGLPCSEVCLGGYCNSSSRNVGIYVL